MTGASATIGNYARGERHPCAKLTEHRVKRMRLMYEAQGFSVKDIAGIMNVNYWTVWDVVSYDTWRHVR